MKQFIENQQFYYINDHLNLKDNLREDELSFELVTRELERMALTANDSVRWLNDSADRSLVELEKWHKAYVEKIEQIKNGASLIQGENLSLEDAGHYAIAEINTDANNSPVFSIEENGYTMPPYDERYAK